MSKIEATAISLYDFFTKDSDGDFTKKFVSSRLEIPAFQRNYSWDNKHVKDLLDSISQNNENYYIGNILIQKTENGSSSGDLVIDGQQRITTLLLILSACLKLKKINKIKEVLFFNIQKEVPRVSFIRKNLDTSFKNILYSDSVEENFSDENSKKFLNNFNCIEKYLKSIEDIDKFIKKVLSLNFVVIVFKQGFDVNQLFEGLNSKGKILSSVQLTKNALLGSIKGDIDSQKIVEIWEEIESLYETKKVFWFDKFLRHFGFLKYGYVSSNGLFKKIKADIKNVDILEFSLLLKNNSNIYFKLRTNTLLKSDISESLSDVDWVVISSIIKNISYSDLDQVYSTLFASIIYAKNNESYRKGKNSRLLRDIKRIWSFSILAKYLDIKPSAFETHYANFAHNLFLGEYKKSQELFVHLSSIIKNLNPEKFSTNLNNRIKITGELEKNVNSKNNRSFISQLLFCYLQDGKKFIIEDSTIEHIIPKGKKNGLENWKTINKAHLKEVSNISRYKFGNLTLLNTKDDLGNASFKDKLDGYIKDGYIKNQKIKKYSRYFQSNNPSDAVNLRGDEIAKDLFNILKDILELK